MKILKYVLVFVFGLVVSMFLFVIVKNPIEFKKSPEKRLELLQNYTVEELKNEILSKEQKSIIDYIGLECDLERTNTWWIQSNHINLKLINNASFATAKDISLMIYLYSKTNTCYDSVPYIWYDYLKPRETVEFTHDLKFDENLNNVECKIKDVKPEIKTIPKN